MKRFLAFLFQAFICNSVLAELSSFDKHNYKDQEDFNIYEQKVIGAFPSFVLSVNDQIEFDLKLFFGK
jgi:hypothetical protein